MSLRNIIVALCFLLVCCKAELNNRIYRRCLMQPEYSPTRQLNVTRAKFFSESFINVTSDRDSLLDAMAFNPCLEIEYNHESFHRSTHFIIYGTCNLNRMFRFVLEQANTFCWNMQLHLWDPSEESDKVCRQLPLSDTYTGSWNLDISSAIQLGINFRAWGNDRRKKVMVLKTEPWTLAGRDPNFPAGIINRTECSCCWDASYEITGLHYEHTWNAECGSMLPTKYRYVMLHAQSIARLYMAITLVAAIVVLMEIVRT